MTIFIIARTASGRPSLQHALSGDHVTTRCGLDTTLWSRAYQAMPISQVVCKKCQNSIR